MKNCWCLPLCHGPIIFLVYQGRLIPVASGSNLFLGCCRRRVLSAVEFFCSSKSVLVASGSNLFLFCYQRGVLSAVEFFRSSMSVLEQVVPILLAWVGIGPPYAVCSLSPRGHDIPLKLRVSKGFQSRPLERRVVCRRHLLLLLLDVVKLLLLLLLLVALVVHVLALGIMVRVLVRLLP